MINRLSMAALGLVALAIPAHGQTLTQHSYVGQTMAYFMLVTGWAPTDYFEMQDGQRVFLLTLSRPLGDCRVQIVSRNTGAAGADAWLIENMILHGSCGGL